MVSLRGSLGVHPEAGPTTDQIIAASRDAGLVQEDRKLLALSIFTGFIEGESFQPLRSTRQG
ncbi:hypothetical protein Bca52824_048276 [Brassica carinata]|uniref:Uncharacterized protein n=1 Tax=Brassica carinata TaxID=52824 RepID=A0A8X7RIU6_BRACI|nr:hypothetical protein Bca52824_048276 [Brassica carinata]